MAVGRSRSRARTGWPANVQSAGGGYEYCNPATGKRTYLGRDQAAVFVAARKLNALLAAPADDLIAKVVGRTETIDDAIALFRTEDMPGREWAAKTAELYKSVLDRTSAAIGKRACEGFSVRDCADFLRDVTASNRARQQFRLALQWVLACAVEEGWIDTNPALQVRKAVYKRKRERLTIEQFRAIHDKAAPWLQNAMDVSMLTLLRREDVCALRFADVRESALWVIPGKTEGSTGARLKIKFAPDGPLAALLARCRDNTVSPYLIHRLPDRAKPHGARAQAREHHTQVLPEQLSRAFADARDTAGICGDNPPTFHEIRSLGGALLVENGWNVARVQALMAHASEAMTEHYLDGHDVPWTEVQIG